MAEDELILGYKLTIFKREDGSRYIKTKNKLGEDVTNQDIAVFGLHLDKAKQELMEGFEPDADVETISEGLFDS